VQIVLNSGITAGSIAAIVLNVAFNILGGGEERPEPTSVATAQTRGDTMGPV
jgi:xanthine/uracil permease